jgi:hypothetical protein
MQNRDGLAVQLGKSQRTVVSGKRATSQKLWCRLPACRFSAQAAFVVQASSLQIFSTKTSICGAGFQPASISNPSRSPALGPLAVPKIIPNRIHSGHREQKPRNLPPRIPRNPHSHNLSVKRCCPDTRHASPYVHTHDLNLDRRSYIVPLKLKILTKHGSQFLTSPPRTSPATPPHAPARRKW